MKIKIDKSFEKDIARIKNKKLLQAISDIISLIENQAQFTKFHIQRKLKVIGIITASHLEIIVSV